MSALKHFNGWDWEKETMENSNDPRWHDRLKTLAVALSMTPTPRLDIGLSWVSGRRAWWLLGCKEGDQPLPQTSDCHTAQEAIDAAEGWLMPEICRLLDENDEL